MIPETIEKSASQTELWQRYADQFPVRKHLVYLNHAAVAPLVRPAAEAMKWLAEVFVDVG